MNILKENLWTKIFLTYKVRVKKVLMLIIQRQNINNNKNALKRIILFHLVVASETPHSARLPLLGCLWQITGYPGRNESQAKNKTLVSYLQKKTQDYSIFSIFNHNLNGALNW